MLGQDGCNCYYRQYEVAIMHHGGKILRTLSLSHDVTLVNIPAHVRMCITYELVDNQ